MAIKPPLKFFSRLAPDQSCTVFLSGVHLCSLSVSNPPPPLQRTIATPRVNESFCFLPDRSFLHLGAGLSVGLSGLAAGFAIGIVGDAGVRGTAQQPRLFVGMILILIFAEVLGLYGLIVALILSTK